MGTTIITRLFRYAPSLVAIGTLYACESLTNRNKHTIEIVKTKEIDAQQNASSHAGKDVGGTLSNSEKPSKWTMSEANKHALLEKFFADISLDGATVNQRQLEKGYQLLRATSSEQWIKWNMPALRTLILHIPPPDRAEPEIREKIEKQQETIWNEILQELPNENLRSVDEGQVKEGRRKAHGPHLKLLIENNSEIIKYLEDELKNIL